MRSVKDYSELEPHERQMAEYRPGLCEQYGGHEVKRPRVWPPVLRHLSQRDKGKTYASVVCEKCGATVVIYDPLPDGVRWADDKKPEARKA